MAKVLVAGGCGFLGSHLCDRLLLRPDVELCVVVDNLWTGRLENLAHLRDERLRIVLRDVETFHCDIQFDEVYHFASPATPLYYMNEPQRTISANVVGAIRLLGLLKPGGRFAFASTSEVYGESSVNPLPESYRGNVDCTGPRSSYDESKRCTESLLFETCRTSGLDLRVARMFNVYGPRTRSDDGRAISNFISQGLSGRPLTIYGDGLQSRSWGYVDDVMNGLERFFWKDPVHCTGPMNLGSDREISVLEIARYVSRLCGGNKIQHLKAAPQDPSSRRPDLTLARQIIPGWDCRIPFERGVGITVEWFRQQKILACQELVA